MKAIHTSILDILIRHFSMEDAVQITDYVLEFGFKNTIILHFDIADHLMDFFPESKARSIADECISNL